MTDETTPEGSGPDPAMLELLRHMLKIGASDLYVTAESPPVFRVGGVGYPARTRLEAEQVAELALSLMTPAQREELATVREMNLALQIEGEGRFRVNVFHQRGAMGMVVRLIRTKIETLDDLRLPPVLKAIPLSRRGLVLVVGGTGSGKSTTLAAMIDHRNATETGHILTVEDPIEFIHPHKRCVVTQREVGVDTLSFGGALKNALRQAPDLILIGEIRDVETMEAAVAFAETGHLCLSTLHANNANQALERVLNFFPPARHHEIRMQLALNLRAVVSQRLVPAVGGGRAAALEILLDTPRIKDLIKRGEIDMLKDAMEQSVTDGCQTFDGALFDLLVAGRVGPEEALRAADSPNNLRLRIERFCKSHGRDDGVPGGSEPPLRLAGETPQDRPPRTESGVVRIALPDQASAAGRGPGPLAAPAGNAAAGRAGGAKAPAR